MKIGQVKRDKSINYLHIFFVTGGIRWHKVVDLDKVKIIIIVAMI